uniref:Uncharacterized protein n=1 Tax=Leersia perrieri TaxID=77586 RepID=A0A0D9XZ11_9ORYZ
MKKKPVQRLLHRGVIDSTKAWQPGHPQDARPHRHRLAALNATPMTPNCNTLAVAMDHTKSIDIDEANPRASMSNPPRKPSVVPDPNAAEAVLKQRRTLHVCLSTPHSAKPLAT